MFSTYGWSESLQRDFEPFAAQGLVPARVIVQQRGLYRLAAPSGEIEGRISGRFAHEAAHQTHQKNNKPNTNNKNGNAGGARASE